MVRTVYDFNVGVKVIWYGNNSKTTLLNDEVKLINDKLGLLFVRHQYDGNYFLKEIHGSEVIEHESCLENNERTIKIGDMYYHNFNENKVGVILEILDWDMLTGLFEVRESVGREFKISMITEDFIKRSCSPVDEYMDLAYILNRPLNDDELSYAKENGFSDTLSDSRNIIKQFNVRINKENLKDLKFDEINKPKHYNSTKYETKEVIKDILSNYKDTTPYTQYCIGNLLKYISRGPLKENLLKDLKKGMFYLEESIKEIEGEIDE